MIRIDLLSDCWCHKQPLWSFSLCLLHFLKPLASTKQKKYFERYKWIKYVINLIWRWAPKSKNPNIYFFQWSSQWTKNFVYNWSINISKSIKYFRPPFLSLSRSLKCPILKGINEIKKYITFLFGHPLSACNFSAFTSRVNASTSIYIDRGNTAIFCPRFLSD